MASFFLPFLPWDYAMNLGHFFMPFVTNAKDNIPEINRNLVCLFAPRILLANASRIALQKKRIAVNVRLGSLWQFSLRETFPCKVGFSPNALLCRCLQWKQDFISTSKQDKQQQTHTTTNQQTCFPSGTGAYSEKDNITHLCRDYHIWSMYLSQGHSDEVVKDLIQFKVYISS